MPEISVRTAFIVLTAKNSDMYFPFRETLKVTPLKYKKKPHSFLFATFPMFHKAAS